MKTKAFKRVASLAIACCLIITGFVMPAFAADDQLGVSYGLSFENADGDFGDVFDDYTTAPSKTFTIENLGASSLGISGLKVELENETGPETAFAVVSLGTSSLGFSGTTTVEVEVVTNTIGTYTADLVVSGEEIHNGTTYTDTVPLTLEIKSSYVPVSSITLNDYNINIYVNGTGQLTATVYPGGATNPGVAWSSSNSNIATVDQDGLVTGVSEGTAIITATADGEFAQATVTVSGTGIAVTDVEIDPLSVLLEVNEEYILTAKITPANATNQNITWSSSDSSIATVDSNGKVTAVSSGLATIYAEADNGVYGVAFVTVRIPIIYMDVITYNANGGSGSMDKGFAIRGTEYTIADNEFTAPSGRYVFQEWNTEADGSGTSCQPGDVVEVTRSFNLYAIWRYVGGGSSGSSSGGDHYTGTSNSGGGRGGSTTVTTTTADTYPAVTQETASTAVDAAIAAAGDASSATVKMNNVGLVTQSVFQSMAAQAEAVGITSLTFMADSLNAAGTAVEVRIALDVAKVSGDLVLSASTTSAQALRVTNIFNTFFSNKTAVISFGQKGSFGQEVTISALVDLDGMDIENLVFYSYDSATNTYQRFDTDYSIDGNGYLVFVTELGGDIIISDGVLVQE